MRPVAAVVLCGLALAAAAVPGARAADECRGLMACISVPGPWVVVPAPATGQALSSARWQLRCPEGTVAGLDARLSDRNLDVDFGGLLGSPVTPGVTTRDRVLFTGSYTGRLRKATSFRPFIGCVAGGGGRRTPTAFKPGEPTVLRVRNVRVRPGSLVRSSLACRARERLLRSSHALGFFVRQPPTARQVAQVRSAATIAGGRILFSASRRGLDRSIGVVLQVQALCTRAPGSGP